MERISDETLNKMIHHEKQIKATRKKSCPVEEIIKSLESISETFLVASVKNGEITGTFCGNESELLSIVNFTFDKLEEAVNGEITKHDLIDALLSAEGEE